MNIEWVNGNWVTGVLYQMKQYKQFIIFTSVITMTQLGCISNQLIGSSTCVASTHQTSNLESCSLRANLQSCCFSLFIEDVLSSSFLLVRLCLNQNFPRYSINTNLTLWHDYLVGFSFHINQLLIVIIINCLY